MKPAPIIIFVYNRPEHLRRTLQSLSACTLAPESDLFVFSDGPRTDLDEIMVDRVYEIIHHIEGFKNVEIFTYDHRGLSRSVIDGVTKVLSDHERVIVLEDDLILSRNFLVYMNTCMDLFWHRADIASISGYALPIEIPGDYPHPVYLSRRPGSWGWATWRDRWKRIYWNHAGEPDKKAFNLGGDDLTRMLKQQRSGKIDSWAVRWAHHNSRNSLYTVCPVVSKVFNAGTRGGTHFRGNVNRFDVTLDRTEGFVLRFSDIQPDDVILERFRKFWKYSLWKKFKLFLLDLL